MCVIEFLFLDFISHKQEKPLLHKYFVGIGISKLPLHAVRIMPKQLSFRSTQILFFCSLLIYSHNFFNNNFIAILFINGWRQSFAKLRILKANLHNSAAFCLWQKFLRDLPENVTLYCNTINLHLQILCCLFLNT